MWNDLLMGSPVYLSAALAIIIILVDAFSGKNKSLTFYFALVSLIAVGIMSAYTINMNGQPLPEGAFSNGMIAYGGVSAVFDILFVIAGILTLFASESYMRAQNVERKEFYSLILFAVCGMSTIAHANNMLILFVGIEIMSITFYIMAGFFRERFTSVEAALKYFLLGAFATGFLIYGMALIYGATGGLLDFEAIGAKMLTGNVDFLYLKIGFALLIVGLSFKVAAFPFHQWAPDVYQGAPTMATAFMSTAGKAAALAALILVTKAMLPMNFDPALISDKIIEMTDFTSDARWLIAIISALTMLVGNISAVVQKNVKRMLAYSSVAHAGYLLMGIVSNSINGWSGIVFYSMAYMFMQIGAFVVVGIIEKNDGRMDLKDYTGLSKTNPMLAAMMGIFMFSLAGIPPFGGFPGKYMLFIAAIESGFTWLTIVAVISTIISIYFYIGLIVFMYFKDSETPMTEKFGFSKATLTLVISTIFVILLGIFPTYLIDLVKGLF
ncbi:MAG: NADH-quinone oxidoreductase subunit N [Candidatus Kapabacteria bacterium]|nr:NADH-quinone oxidoreductase subunit N [Candidatus Kapabacteria bacterium]